MEMDNYLYLPTEIITEIFKYLHYNELQTASRISKYWYNAKFLTKTFQLHNVLIICKENLKCIPSMNANLFHNIKIRNLSKSGQIQLCEYLNDFEGIIKTRHITLEDLEVCDDSTLLILKKLCTNLSLKSIEFNCRTNNFITKNFDDLKYLLKNIEKFSINLAKLTSNLSLKPIIRSIDMQKEIFRLMSNLPNLVHLKCLGDEKETIFKVKKLLNNLPKKMETLEIHYVQELNYSQNFVNDQMSHKSNFARYNTIIMENLHRLNNLTQLILSQSFINDNFFQIISKNMKKLQTLKLNECYGKITGRDIIYLKDLKCLKVLNLNNFKKSKNQFSYGLEFGIFEKCNENLEELKLNLLNLNESCVCKISNLPNLRILELKDNPGVTNEALQPILFNCRLLRSLNLSFNNRISDVGVSRLISISELKGLRELEMVECSITDEVLEKHFKFLELRKINLRGCLITPEGVQCMLKNCPSLKEVFFSY